MWLFCLAHKYTQNKHEKTPQATKHANERRRNSNDSNNSSNTDLHDENDDNRGREKESHTPKETIDENMVDKK